MRAPIPEHIWALARGSKEAIPYKDLTYDEWLGLQHAWMLDRLGLIESDSLAIALRALDTIARKAVNGSGTDKYYLARHALEATGGWRRKTDDD